MGNGFLLILLLSSLQIQMKQIVLFILKIIIVGAAYFELFSRFKTSMYTNLLTSVLRVSSCAFGMGNDLVWYS